MASIAFDLDGTLVDSAPDIHALVNALLNEEGAEPLEMARVRSFIGEGTRVLIERVCEARGLSDAERLHATFMERYPGKVELTRPYDGVVEVMDALAAAGHTLSICTNKPEAPCLALLDHLGWSDRFAAVICGDTLEERKPDPAPLRAALGEAPHVYVGDSETDAATAEAADVPFLLHTEGYLKGAAGDVPCVASFRDWTLLPGLVGKHAI